MFSPQHWPARYWGDRYWPPLSFTGSLAPALEGSTGALGGIVWRIGTLTPTLEGMQAAMVGGLVENGGNYWPEFHWPPQHNGQWWKEVEPSMSAGALAGAVADAVALLSGISTGPGVITGNIALTLEGASGALVGILVHTQYLDIAVSLQLAWSSEEFAGNTGDFASLLEEIDGHLVGTFTAAGAEIGSIAVQLDGLQAALTGASTEPSNETGAIAMALEDLVGNLLGVISQPEGRIGELAASIDDLLASLAGSAFIPNPVGAWQSMLDETGAALQGLTFTGYVLLGPLKATLDATDMRSRGIVAVSLPVLARNEFTVAFESGQCSVEHERETYELVELP